MTFFIRWFVCLFVQSVLGKMNEIAKHKTAIEDADTQNKVCMSLVVQQRQQWSAVPVFTFC